MFLTDLHMTDVTHMEEKVCLNTTDVSTLEFNKHLIKYVIKVICVGTQAPLNGDIRQHWISTSNVALLIRAQNPTEGVHLHFVQQ